MLSMAAKTIWETRLFKSEGNKFIYDMVNYDSGIPLKAIL